MRLLDRLPRLSAASLPDRAGLAEAAQTAQNVIEYLRFGGLETGEESSPHEVAMRAPTLILRRYFADDATTSDRAPVLLVPPLMLSADVWDVSPGTSAVAHLHRAGLDPWVVDFGDPAREPGGRQRNVTDHVLAVSDAIDAVASATGRSVHIGGYSQGGLFCYQAAALRRSRDVASIFALGSPMEPLSLPGLDLPEELLAALTDLGISILSRTGLPGWAASNLFSWTSPVATAKQRIQYLGALRDREALLPREKQRRFLGGEGWITFPGPAIAEVMESMTNERFVRGGLVFGDRTVSLADITCPILIFTGQYDAFAPPRAVRDVVKGVPRADVWELSMPTGHFGLGVGGRANHQTWPTVTQWTAWIDGNREDRPGGIVDARAAAEEDAPEVQAPSSLRRAVDLGTIGVLAAPGIVRGVVGRTTASLGDLSSEALEQLPRLLRLERVGPATHVSYGRLIAESAAEDPGGVALLYGGRAFTRLEIQREVDETVLRLLSVGVRRGEHVGVLMGSGSALLVTAAALSRIGSVAVLLRPDGDTAAELRAGRAKRLLVDDAHLSPELAELARVHLLSSHPSQTDTPAGVHDLRLIAPESVRPPTWYRPDPGRGRDLAFVLFGDSADGLRPMPVTNRRWALSAHGAALAAGLTASDTVYSANPLYHPSGLLLATAAPVASGARLALTDTFDPKTFWSDVRSYGATVVPYTWNMLEQLLRQPHRPEEDHHPVRVFVGSGMSTATWRAVADRFAPATVLELFAAARTEAILANVTGRKTGSAGRPLPGTARVELGAVRPVTDELVQDADGYVVRARTGQIGRLLVEADREHPLWDDVPLRGAFGPGDAWVDTGELFRRDEGGDLWPLGRAGDALATPQGPVRRREVDDALARIPGINLVAVLDVDGRATAAVSLADGCALDHARVARVLAEVSPAASTVDVVVVDDLPLTRWFRPDTARLREILGG